MSDYECVLCHARTSMFGHYVTDDEGFFYTCREPERAAKRLTRIRWDEEAKERAELTRLQAKYPAPLQQGEES